MKLEIKLSMGTRGLNGKGRGWEGGGMGMHSPQCSRQALALQRSTAPPLSSLLSSFVLVWFWLWRWFLCVACCPRTLFVDQAGLELTDLRSAGIKGICHHRLATINHSYQILFIVINILIVDANLIISLSFGL